MSRQLNDNVVIFDIDGCISDDSWRRSRIPEGASQPLEYDFYHAGCKDDPPLEMGAQVLRMHIQRGDFIAFCTARPAKTTEMTVDWIKRHFDIDLTQDYMLLSRSDEDARSAVAVKTEMASYLRKYEQQINKKLVAAYDDRPDIVEMYRQHNLAARVLDQAGLHGFPETPSLPVATPEQTAELLEHVDAAAILENAARTFRERNENYKDNAVLVGQIMQLFFPEGVALRSQNDHHFYHLFELMIVKLTRFVKSDLRHADSIHDLAVYAAMCETLVDKHAINILDEFSEL